VLVAEPMAAIPGAEAVGDAYFGFYLLAMGSGRPRSAARHAQLLTEAGFERPAVHAARRPMLTGLVSARKPA
jgi:demethylspheroidene O-methyltransferase